MGTNIATAGEVKTWLGRVSEGMYGKNDMLGETRTATSIAAEDGDGREGDLNGYLYVTLRDLEIQILGKWNDQTRKYRMLGSDSLLLLPPSSCSCSSHHAQHPTHTSGICTSHKADDTLRVPC